MKVLLMFAAGLVLVLPVRAQRLTLAYQFGDYTGLGHPGVLHLARADVDWRVLRAQADFSPTHKYNGSGYSYRLGVASFTPLLHGFRWGVGLDHTGTRTAEWSKTVWRPYVEGAFSRDRGETFVRYRFSGYDPHNHLQAVEFGGALWPSRHVGVMGEGRRVRFHDTDHPAVRRHAWVWTFGPAVRF